MTLATLQQLVASPPAPPGPAESTAARQAVIAEVAAAGLPTPRRESWRYTDLKSLADTAFDFGAGPPDGAAVSAAARALAADELMQAGPRIVLVDGHPVAELASLEPGGGLEIRGVESGWARLAALHRKRVTAADHPLAALNFAYSPAGAWLRVPDGVQVAEPLNLVLVGSGEPGRAPQPRLVIELGAGAELTIVQHLLDARDGSAWVNAVTQVEQAPDSRLSLYRIQRHGAGVAHTSLLTVDLAARAAARIGYVDVGGRLVRNDVDVKLGEPGASVELFGVFLASRGQHVDNHTRIDHAAPTTRSDESFRGIIGRRGRGVFNGKVVVHAGAQHTDARQSSDNLLLAEQAEIDTKPELEIYADDVKCSHGSTVGELDPDHLFYVRSRGLDDASARELLTSAFAAAIIERFAAPAVRTSIEQLVGSRLRGLAEAVS
jgi:Fe-S cluster assembly protein SufD